MPHPVCGDAYSERRGRWELLDRWSGGVRDILNQRVSGRDGDVVGLSVVKLSEKVFGGLSVLPNEGVELVVGRCWGVDGRVGVSGHASAVEDAEGVSTEGGVGLAMLEGGSLLGFLVLGLFARGWWL